MKRGLLEQIILYDYRYIIGYGALLIVSLFTLFWRLGSLVPGISGIEAEYLAQIDLGSLLDNPIFWPHKLLTYGLIALLGPTAWAFRLSSVILAIIGLAAFFAVIKHRFKGRIAIVVVGLLATSSWWLSFARMARPEIIIPVTIFVLMYLSGKVYETQKIRWLFLLIIAVSFGMYIPYIPYVILIGFLASRSLIGQFLESTKRQTKFVGILIFLLLITPLIYASVKDIQVLRDILNIPETIPHFYDVVKNIGSSISEVFWKANEYWTLRLGTLPLLDLFSAVMVALGLYHLDHEISRTLTQFVLIGLGMMLIIINLAPTPLGSVVLIPFIYTLAAAGIVMLLSQWYEIFPKNPIARMTALVPTLLLLVNVIWYHQQRYFIAWPSTPEVVQQYPALVRELQDELSKIEGTNSIVLADESEIQMASVVTSTHSDTLLTTVNSAVIGQENIIMTNTSYENLPKDIRNQINGNLRPIVNESKDNPVALWVNTTPGADTIE